jgi:uncharacterized protein YbjT (DUF2867 family)
MEFPSEKMNCIKIASRVPTIAVYPASSRSGLACVKKLAESGVAPLLRVATRSQAKFPKESQLLTGIDANNRDSLSKVFSGIQSAVLVTPHDPKIGSDKDADLTISMIDEAVKAGVNYIVLIGSWTVHEPIKVSLLSDRFIKPEAYLKKMEQEFGLNWTVLRGGFFIQNLLMAWGKQAKKTDAIIFPDVKFAPIDVNDIGKCAAVCIMEGYEKHHGKYYEMNGPVKLTTNDMVKKIGEARGKPIDYKMMKASEMKVPEYFKQAVAFMEGSSIPFNNDVGNLIGAQEWTTFDQWALQNKDSF